VTVPNDHTPFTRADPMQMRQLFQNLIADALKYHRLVEKNRIEIIVQDNGIGLDMQ
jgi:signal transduction histidine kinase